jgi:hypothetical protein
MADILPVSQGESPFVSFANGVRDVCIMSSSQEMASSCMS